MGLRYKSHPWHGVEIGPPGAPTNCEITHTYGLEEAIDLIERSIEDYRQKFENLDSILSMV